MNESHEQREGRERAATLAGRVAESCLRISSFLDLADVLDAIAQEAQRVTGSAYAAVQVVSPLHGALSGLHLSDIGLEEFNSLIRVASEEETTKAAERQEQRTDSEVSGHLPVLLLQARIELEGGFAANIYAGNPPSGGSFTAEDAELLQMLALHSSSAVANAVLLRNEQLARSEIESLLENAPSGIFIFETESGELRATNGEGTRLTQGSFEWGSSVREFAELLELQQPNGQIVAFDEHPIAQAIETGCPIPPQQYLVTISKLLTRTARHSRAGGNPRLLLSWGDLLESEPSFEIVIKCGHRRRERPNWPLPCF